MNNLIKYLQSFFETAKPKTRKELFKELSILTNELVGLTQRTTSLEPAPPVPWTQEDCKNLGDIIAALQTTYSRECPII